MSRTPHCLIVPTKGVWEFRSRKVVPTEGGVGTGLGVVRSCGLQLNGLGLTAVLAELDRVLAELDGVGLELDRLLAELDGAWP